MTLTVLKHDIPDYLALSLCLRTQLIGDCKPSSLHIAIAAETQIPTHSLGQERSRWRRVVLRVALGSPQLTVIEEIGDKKLVKRATLGLFQNMGELMKRSQVLRKISKVNQCHLLPGNRGN